MHIVLNELSVNKTNCHFAKKTPQGVISEFVELLHNLLGAKKVDSLVASTDIYSFQLNNNYGVADWLKDPYVKHSHKQFLRTVYGNRCSFINAESYSISECKIEFDGQYIPSIGCLVAHETHSNVISARTHEVWEKRTISGIHNILDENAEVFSDEIRINNISSNEHIREFEQENRTTLFIQISSGQDLWEKRELLFPHLQFCESVKDQLYNDPEKFHIDQIASKLVRLDQYFSTYTGNYSPHILGMGARTESQTVKDTPELRNMRRFKKPDGNADYFFDHIGFTGKYCGRIHFIPDSQTRTGIIGYIGKHLKTDRYNP